MASPSFLPPIDCGQRLIPNLIDKLAREQPEKPFVSVARSADPSHGFEDISFGMLATAIDKCAWWIEKTLGRSSTFETIYTQLDPHDLRHPILVVACVKTGYKMFFSSPVNTLDSHLGLLDRLQCNTFLLPRIVSAVGRQILERRPMRTLQLPEINHLLRPSTTVPRYPYNKTFAEAQHDPFVVFHSSGATGVPKTMIYKHGSDAAIDAYQLLPSLGDVSEPWVGFRLRGKRVFSCQPWFHACGIPLLLNAAIYYDFVGVIMPAVQKFDVATVTAIHKHANVQVSYLNPALLIEIAKSPSLLETLRSLSAVCFTGGALPQPTGDTITSQTTLLPFFGSTECSSMPVAPPPSTSSDWQYYRFSPFFGASLRPFDGKFHELVITRSARNAPFQGVFCTFPDAGTEYHTRDLFVEHSHRPGWWRHCGRADDVCVFSDGRKFNPLSMEAAVETHHAVETALVCGHGRARPSLLIQPHSNVPCKTRDERRSLLADVWPTIELAVAQAPLSGRVTPDMVLFTTPEKPMVCVGHKMTIQRMKTVALYSREVDELYAAAAGTGDAVSSSATLSAHQRSFGFSDKSVLVKAML